jgi:amidohydrolase
MIEFAKEAESLFEFTQAMRRDFHRHPELGFQEVRTAGIVANELSKEGIEFTTGIAKTGVVALIEGGQPGPVVLLRFDMDALPIIEETGAEYASQNPGVMHACGHDGHTAIGLTVAKILNNHRKEWAGTVKLVFQPAEEGLGGADRMVAAGVLEDPKPDLTLTLHLWNEKPFGWLGITSGPVMAASEAFHLRISGKGGHGAAPHLAIDPILTSAQIITALQSIVSRNVPPLQSAVLSVTSVQGGHATNVIPPYVDLKGTIRSYEPAIRSLIIQRFQQIVTGVAQTMGCQADIQMKRISPAVVNNPEITRRVEQVARQLLPDSMIDTDERTMGSEDMAYMMEQIPGSYFFVGSANAEKGLNAAHHHPRFDFDESALPRAAALMTAAAVEFLKPQ